MKEILNRPFQTEQIVRAYKRVSGWYDLWAFLTESKASKKAIEWAEIEDGMSVLEVACGTGLVFAELVKRNPHGENVGIDLSPDMLQKAKGRLADMPSNCYELKLGDAFNLDFENDHFDLLVNNFMIDLLPVESFDRVLSEFSRVIKPGGRMIISTFSFGQKPVHRFWWWVAKNFPDLLTGCRPVLLDKYLLKQGLEIEASVEISQNTFPSRIIKARKPNLK
ncbi:MAG: methyltransferase domain-containing protein [Bacteroidetes bacterium]|nr:MAG: methyltransferase domain-containing protein [Bacteroidota bacterium]